MSRIELSCLPKPTKISSFFLLFILAGEGLGSDKRGRADPVMAGEVKKDNLGVGAQKSGEVNPDDDIYEQYKKRMMLGYRYRPNPLVKTLLLFLTYKRWFLLYIFDPNDLTF